MAKKKTGEAGGEVQRRVFDNKSKRRGKKGSAHNHLLQKVRSSGRANDVEMTKERKINYLNIITATSKHRHSADKKKKPFHEEKRTKNKKKTKSRTGGFGVRPPCISMESEPGLRIRRNVPQVQKAGGRKRERNETGKPLKNGRN